MTQERFHRLLENPELLASIPYEEMKTLALAYPYAHNLRYLLALKARQDDHPEAERTLTTAAVYSLDRTQLYHLTAIKIPAVLPVSVVMEEAILELKPIELVQRELEALAPQPRTAKPETTAMQEAAPLPPVEDSASPSPEPPAEEKSRRIVLHEPFAIWMARFNPPVLNGSGKVATVEAIPGPEAAPVAGEPEAPPEETAELTPAPAEPASPALSAQELAERSVTENRDVISETLARLLARQGYREKAIDMYQRLCLAFPEKSQYFAAEIEKLKK